MTGSELLLAKVYTFVLGWAVPALMVGFFWIALNTIPGTQPNKYMVPQTIAIASALVVIGVLFVTRAVTQ